MNSLSKLLSERLEGFRWKGGEWAGSLCPFPDHKDTAPSFRINLHKGFFSCFGCQRSGSMAELLTLLGLPGTDVDSLLSSITFIKELKKENRVEVLPEYILAAFRRCPKALLDAGFSKELLRDNDVGFDLARYCITYPLRDKNGLLTAVYRRTDVADFKYIVYDFKDVFDGYQANPKKHLWGLHKVYASYVAGGERKPLVVTEGFKACLWVLQHGYNAVATMGTMMTKDQTDLLSLMGVPLVWFFDNDDSGQKGAVLAYKKLRRRVSDIAFVSYPDGLKQPDDFTSNYLHEAISKPKTFTEWRKTCRISSKTLAKMLTTPLETRPY